ncbi:tagatose-bisphosphate aldolase noncatalytic subunit [Granulicella rosea]|uniref:Tagatose-bisphosphate aldolase noncatalytic subunit n=1 Tax=Granulicella rosea TaxID=474952 RepID=A0A239MGV8_9BACT|nr:D-tagatose-bisphosphate aldolase, class II, non-catalytic subunit [Granulicella rosea]SNT41906.1 tagatose-bisphosphate aldolase noncatalytic subunit [Granulicella rosea]
MSEFLETMGAAYAAGAPFGLYSVCSAHPLVLQAAILQALDDHSPLLVEATSNQVNQFGGYTGMRPADFRNFVVELAVRLGFAPDNLILGGDHLGPNPWQHLPEAEAMQHAEMMVAEYSRAGFVKIHLDASMPCLGDPAILPDRTIAERAARLCRAAEAAANGAPRFYVIGTEVPVPGGATESLSELEVTHTSAARHTLGIHREVFAAAGLERVWPRVIALVVQPGVEFNHDSVVDYTPSKTESLRTVLSDAPGMVFEAHSTDYQRPAAYHQLVQDGFTILKVGPALTFALREALFALEKIEQELLPTHRLSHLSATLEHEMLTAPGNWRKHYHGTPIEQRILRRYSYSDRMRYYWKQPAVEQAVEKLMQNLEQIHIPETLLSAALPDQYRAVRAGKLRPAPEALILHKIREALVPYAEAGICRLEQLATASY